MKKINLILGALACLFAFSACTEEVEYTPATPDSGVYFPSTLPSKVDLTTDKTSFDVYLYRTDSVGEQTLALQAATSDETGIYTFPETATFADGAKTAKITIEYDLTKMSYDQFTDITLSVDKSLTSAYGGNEYAFTAGIPAPFKSLGKGKYSDSYLLAYEYDVEIQQSVLEPTMFRIVKPYHEGMNTEWGGVSEVTEEYLYVYLLQPGESVYDITITEKDLVYFDLFNTGIGHPSYDNTPIQIAHPALFQGMTEADFMWNKVKSYQENGLPAQIQLAPLYYMAGVGGIPYYDEDDMITITFPGVKISDYSVGISYTGRFTDPKNKVSADLNVTMGADVASVKVAMAITDNPQTVVTGILDGSIEAVEITEAGTVRMAMKDAGKYAAVAISFDAEGNPQKAAAVQFVYEEATNSAWKSLGKAQYTDGFISSVFTVPVETYEVEVQANQDKPGLYRLVNPYGAAFPLNEPGDWDAANDYYLEINAQDPQGVYIETQQLGCDWGYGMFSGSSIAAQYLAGGNSLEAIKNAGYCGTLVDGVITFPTQGLLLCAEVAPLDGWFYANVQYNDAGEPLANSGTFKVVLPGTSKSSKSVKAVVNHAKVDKKNVSGKKLTKKGFGLPQDVQLKK